MLTTSSTIADDLREQRLLVDRLRAEPGFVGSVLRSRARRDKKNLLLFVDQFEELYTMVPNLEDRRAFTACLATVADDATSPTRVVVSVRSDFLDRIPEDQGFMAELSRGLFFMNAPNREGLRDALVQPCEMAGYRFEKPEIVEDMLHHLQSTQGALPLLQFAAMKLWESRDPARKLLTEGSYKAIGGIAGALASHADAVLNELAPNARALAKTLFLRLVTPDRTRAIVSLEELRELTSNQDEIQRLIDHLVQARLVVVQTGGGVAQAELVHESLIHGWPMLHRWLDESGEDAAFLDQLRTAAKQWQAKGHDSGLLWRGDTAEEARRFQRRYRGELPQLLTDFLKAVFSLEKRSARRRRAIAIGSVVFLSLLVVASMVALAVIQGARSEAVKQADVARVAEGEAKGAKVQAEAAKAQAEARLVEVQHKERERAEAQKRAEDASEKVKQAYDEVQRKNKDLFEALDKEAEARKHAKTAQSAAERNAAEARHQTEVAARKSAELADSLRKEVEHAHRLEEAQGGAAINDLK